MKTIIKPLKIFTLYSFFILYVFTSASASFAQNSELWCMEFMDDLTGLTIGDNGTVRTTRDGGFTWTLRQSGTSNALKKMFLLYEGSIITVGENGTILKSLNNGYTWYPATSNTNEDLYGVSFYNETGIAVGLNGTVLRSTDEGESWAKINGFSFPDENYRSVSFASQNKAIIAGDSGRILITDDGGASWYAPEAEIPRVNFKFVIMLDEATAYAAGEDGTIIKTTDGGQNWSSLGTGSKNTLYRIRFSNPDCALIVGANGEILKTTDAGLTWSRENSGTANSLNCLFVCNEDIAYAGGQYGMTLKTTDGGITWRTYSKSGPLGDNNNADISNYPNPSNPSTTIKYYVPEFSKVSVAVYDITGRLVSALVNDSREQGTYSVEFNGESLSSGTYFCRFMASGTAGTVSKTLRIMLVK